MKIDHEKPLVSIVLTLYNGQRFLAQQLDSILSQTYKSLEIIVSDDASTDNGFAIAQSRAELDERLVLIHHEKNLGLHANLGLALERATGDYIAISDQDDIWRLDKIEKQLSLLNGSVGIYSDSILIDAEGNNVGATLFESLNIKPREEITKTVSLFFKNVVSGHTLLFHRSLLSMVLPFAEDNIFDYQLALAASCFGGLKLYPDPLVYHRIHGGNHTNALLANKSAIKESSAAARSDERQLHRWLRQQRIQFVLDRVPRASKELREYGNLCDEVFLSDIHDLPSEMARYEQVFFNIRLFNLLRKLGYKHQYCKKLRFSNCFTLAKGKKWDKLFHLFNRKAGLSVIAK